jgi:RNA polymerase sigma-70 factor (ECF subfamily)
MMSAANTGNNHCPNPFDNSNYNSFFDELYTPLCRFSMKFVHEKEVAEDIVQEFFVYLWENWKRLANIESVKSYAYTAVKNRSINHLKKHFLFKNENNLSEITESGLISDLPDPQELLESRELEKILEDAVEALPIGCRTIFTMKRFDDLTNKEVAAKLNISEKTVEAQMTIAIRRITSFVSAKWGLVFFIIIDRFQKFF